MKKATEQLISNFITWLCIFLVTYLFKDAAQATDAKETIAHFLDISQFGYIILGCLVAFTMFSLLGTKTKNAKNQANANHYGHLALDELGSNFYTFGSLCLLFTFMLHHYSLAMGVAIFWPLGLWLKI